MLDFTSKKCPSIQKLFDEADLTINFISIAHKNDDSNSLIQINKKTLKNTFDTISTLANIFMQAAKMLYN